MAIEQANSLTNAIYRGQIQLWHHPDLDSEMHYSTGIEKNNLFFKRNILKSHKKLSTLWFDVNVSRLDMNATVVNHEKDRIKPALEWMKENFSEPNWIILRTGPTIDAAEWNVILHWTLYADDTDLLTYKLTFDGKE